jgi:hypothetical protein
MYIKLKNGEIDKYPYSIADLMADNRDTSFPTELSDSLLAEFNVYKVIQTAKPVFDYTKNVIEETPVFIDGNWVQVFTVVDATPEEIQERITKLNNQASENRMDAYRTESDPLFFKWQRGEADKQEWLYKVSEIKARYPKV